MVKSGNDNTIIATVFGTLFSIAGLEPMGLVSTFVLGAIGAIGGYLGTLFVKWVIKKIMKAIEL